MLKWKGRNFKFNNKYTTSKVFNKQDFPSTFNNTQTLNI